ncbi:class I SAM-dependent methyltransferase [Acidaminobacter sp. JC074]|uniref:class I SAM-dependent DNA methyltransferase n=1 Tax=Acidaminobacter sp. JC074 TaxID=2530199 RepID=UPI001F0D5D74|nr:class I SAM-dependent methyltransferase [Acidaminobacter sp. JC074]MCH4888039.1 class I SAM-dependent methyltransferase [Acidaminobacter sp. JC074]
MKRYIGLLSEVSDLTNRNQIDVDAYVNIAHKYRGKILELGSGSGTISIGLAKEGYDVTCLEIHRDMIHLHEEKLDDDLEKNTTIVLGDMCSFDLNEKYDLIIAAGNLINSIMSEDEIYNMFESVKRHLSDVGVFVIECEYPNINRLIVDQDKEKVEYLENPRTKMRVENRIRSHFNFLEMTRQDHIVVTEFKDDRIKRRIQIARDYKIWTVDEIRDFIKNNAFNIMLESGDINTVEPITDKSSHMIFFLKR